MPSKARILKLSHVIPTLKQRQDSHRYNGQWRKLRDAVINEQPICRCEAVKVWNNGRVSVVDLGQGRMPAVLVDRIRPSALAGRTTEPTFNPSAARVTRSRRGGGVDLRNIGKTQSRVPYRDWVAQGLIEATPGNVTDYAFIEAKVVELAGQYDIQSIAFDRTFSGALVNNLQAEGLDMVQLGQGFISMSSPAKELERMILGLEIEHLDNRVLSWMAGNVVTLRDPAGNIKPDKSKSGVKIDGVTALIMAVGLAQAAQETEVSDIAVWG